MNQLLPFVIVGLTSGSIYAIAALGLVLTYKTSGIFNFSHGAVAAASAYLFYELWRSHGLPWGVSALLVVGVFAPSFGVIMELLARGLATASTAGKIVATVGLMVAIQGLLVALYGSAAKDFPGYLPRQVYDLGGVRVGQDQLITVAIALMSAVGLYTFFRITRTGTAMRAVVDNSDLLDLTGVSPVRVRRASWMIGSSYAALSGILIAPRIGLDAYLLTLLVVQAFGAAAIGSFSSLPLTYLGGLVLGVGAGLSTKYVGQLPALSGFPPSFPFIVLFVVLIVMPRTRLGGASTEPRPRARRQRPSLPTAAQAGLAAAAVTLLALVPTLVGARLPAYTSGLTYALIFASLALLVRTSGQVSLCQLAFAAVGAAAFGHLLGNGVPWLLALPLAGLVAVPIGAIIAIPAIRLPRLYLALATFGFGVLMERLLYTRSFMFGRLGLSVPRPSFARGDHAYFDLVLVVVGVSFVGVQVVTRSRLGRLLRGMADSPTALSTAGLNVNITRVLVFCISAFLAGIAGALLGSMNASVSTASFGSFNSLLLLPVLFLAGSHPLWSPPLAAFALTVAPAYFTGPTFSEYQPVIFGAGALLAALATAGTVDPLSRLTAMARRREPLLRYRAIELRTRTVARKLSL